MQRQKAIEYIQGLPQDAQVSLDIKVTTKGYKTCSKCGKYKPNSAYYKIPNGQTRSSCGACISKREREYKKRKKLTIQNLPQN